MFVCVCVCLSCQTPTADGDMHVGGKNGIGW